MNPEELVKALKEQPKGIKELQAKKSEIENQIGELIGNRFNEVFGKITIGQLRKLWNKADHSQRYWILDSNGDIEEHIDKLESYGGLSSNELIQQIIEEKWDKSEWLEEMDSYFEPYCKETKK